jgi:hypothetical protein
MRYFTTLALTELTHTKNNPQDRVVFREAGEGKRTSLRSLKPLDFNTPAAGKLPFSRPLSKV